MGIFIFDIHTLIGMLFWCNLTCLLLVYIYISLHPDTSDRKLGTAVILAKSLLAASYLLTSYRGALPDFITMNIGNTLLLAGFLAEARSMFLLLDEKNRALMKITVCLAILSAIAFNYADSIPSFRHLRVSVVSLGIITILVIPAAKLLLSRESTSFKRVVGVVYLVFIISQLPRMFFFINNPGGDVYANSFFQVFSFTSLEMLTVFSLPAFLLLMKEQADIKLREMATTDFLTGLPNRRVFLGSVAPAFRRHNRNGTICSIMFLDIDRFKQVNDTLGHAFGDEVLVAMADVLRKSVRGYDFTCRFGGEEFAVFMDGGDAASGAILAERIRSLVEAMRFADQPDFRATISIGVAIGVPGADDSVDAFLGQADEALYEAKESGRNRVVERCVGVGRIEV